MATANTQHLDGARSMFQAAVASATVIAVGDWVYISSGNAYPMSDMADQGDAAANREWAAGNCVGIAVNASVAGDVGPINIVRDGGTWEMTLQAAAAVNVGDKIEIYASATAASDTLVVQGDTSYIGFCTKEKAASGTKIQVKLYLSKWNTPQS